MSTKITITFKDDGELHGEPIGPVTLVIQGDAELPAGWLKLSQIIDFAERHGLILERY